jgi:putative transposase
VSCRYAESQVACEELRAQFAKRYSPLAPEAVERLPVNWERPITFYQFSQEHWRHLWTMSVVESPFAAMRLRTTAAKRFKQVDSATAMLWKVLQVAETTFQRLHVPELLPAVYARAKYVVGIKQIAITYREVAA